MPVVTRKYQVTIPKEIRKSLDIMEGDTVQFIQRGKEVILKPVKKREASFRSLAELIIEIGAAEAEEEMRKGLARSLKVD